VITKLEVPVGTFVPADRFPMTEWRCNMFKSLDIQDHMEVVGSDGKHVGTVEHSVIEGSDRILLSKDDPKAGGRHHLISIDWVDYCGPEGSPQQGVAKSDVGMAGGRLTLLSSPRVAARPKRGRADRAHAKTWIMLEPGWLVRDVKGGKAIEVRYKHGRVH